MIRRRQDITIIKKLMRSNPVVAILGARQSGKTTLAGQLACDHYFDLENPRDLTKFDDPQLTLENLKGVIAIDEIQRAPDLFPLIRHLVDNNKSQKYLVLGSASRDLIRQSSETLAGRIVYYTLGGLTLRDVKSSDIDKLWQRGGFPRSFLARSEVQSRQWRESYIQTFLERDIPQLGIQIPPHTLRRFWIMLSHYHGQVLNHSELGRSFGISDMTVRKYIDILEGVFMVRTLMPWHDNTGKRIVKSPKVYIRDSGLFHSLQSIEGRSQLMSHSKLGASWEGFALECLSLHLKIPAENLYFWGTHAGAELDLYWKQGGKHWGVEFKFASAPKKTKSMISAVETLKLDHLWVVYPGNEIFRLDKKITVLPLALIGEKIKSGI